MQVLRQFIDEHRHTYGVEPICKVLQIAPSGYRRHAAHQRNPDWRCARAKLDEHPQAGDPAGLAGQYAGLRR